MSKSGRAANKVRRTEQQVKQLTELTDMVGTLWGDRPECVEACALFVGTTMRLGIPVKARAVSIFAVDSVTSRLAATGVAAGAEAAALGVTIVGAPADVSAASFERAGHMVVTSDLHSMFFDPTFRQFSRDGLPDVIVAGKVTSVHPVDNRLNVALDGGRVNVAYFFDDENAGWQDGFNAVLPQWGSVAEELASQLRRGGTARTLGFEIPWDEHPGH